MKKLNYFLLGAAGLLLASCSQDGFNAPSSDGNFFVKVQLPGDLGTRALYGQGYAANELFYYVYECDATGVVSSTNPVVEGSTKFPDGSLETEVGFSLANGKYYQMAFFAASSQAVLQGVYKVNPTDATISVDYAKMVYPTNNTDGYDCFYQLYPTGQIGGELTSNSPTVELYRPVAQINWGTNDYAQKAVTNSNAFGANPATTITTTFTADVFTKFNMLTNTVDGASLQQAVEIPAMNVPSLDGYTFPVNGYQYLAMQYVLAPRNATDNTVDGGWLYDVNLNVENEGKTHNVAIAVDNCPLQANWRTNIYGSLLTDNFNVNVVKEPNFDGEFNVPAAWDGYTATTPTQNSEDQYVINAPSDMAGLANGIADGSIDASSDVILNTNIDFNENNFAGLGTLDKPYTGTFDGQGNKISNLGVKGAASTPSGLINVLGEGGSLKNVEFENVNLQGGTSTTANASVGVVGQCAGTVEKVTVNGEVSGTNNVAGVVGKLMSTGVVNECTNNASVSGNYNTAGVVGESNGEITGCSNTGAVTAKNNSVAGVVAEQDYCGKVTGCSNTGTVTAASNSFGVGGIVGWIRYYNNSPVAVSAIEVSGNTNEGDVTGGISAGGIVGRWSQGGTCSENINKGNVTGTDGVAGIVGATANDTQNTDAPTDLEINDNTSEGVTLTGTSNVWTICFNGRNNATFSGNTPENAAVNN